MKDERYDAIIVGAGASGLMAACAALKAGKKILLLEKNPSPGRKILSTGSGKCNLSNEDISPRKYNSSDPRFLREVFAALPPAGIRRFFEEELGLLTKTGENGKIFPYSEKSESVVQVFEGFLEKRGSKARFLFEVTGARREEGFFLVEGETQKPGWHKGDFKGEKISFVSKKLVLACGGPSYPQIGGTRSGYSLAERFGHSVTKPFPAIVPLTVKEKSVRQISGVRLDCALRFRFPGGDFETSGELLFTDYGLSGPAALDAGRRVALEAPDKIKVFIDLMPGFSKEKISGLISKRGGAGGLLDPKLEGYLLERAGGAKNKSSPDSMASLIKNLDFEITGTRDFAAAMTKSGGVPTAEVSPLTFESLREKGLYLTGEMLDVDGETGGYNLHFAWTSGMLAGRAI